MSPKKSKQHMDGDDQDVDFKKIVLMTGSLLCVLLTAPIIYRITMKLIEQDHEQLVNSNLLAFIVTSSFCAGLLLLTNAYFKYFSNLYSDEEYHQLRVSHQPAFLAKLFAIFSSDSRQSGGPSYANDGRRSPFYSGENVNAGQYDSSGKRKIDSKYFKPKFIIHELMTFWGTTCTVITWGSFYIIGGTVVMSERLAQKIKVKSSKSPTKESGAASSFVFSNTTENRGTGQGDFSFSSAFGSSGPPANPPQPRESARKPPFQRISSWTRRSVLSIRKKLSRTVRNNHPRLTTGPANESSSSNIFFFSSPTAS